MKKKIFVSAFACDPTIGSEPGVGWHWALELSKYYEIWVLTVEEDHGSISSKIEKYFREHPNENRGIHFLYYDLPKPIRFLKKNIMGMRFYYILWQFAVNGIIKRIMEENNIEIFHLLTYGNMIWPISNYGQGKRFIWGPTGGMDVIEREYSKYYSPKSKSFEAIRRFIVGFQKMTPGFHRKCKNADLILCKAQSTIDGIPQQYRNKAILFTDVAMSQFREKKTALKKNKSADLLFLSAGHMDAWRGFDMLIEAFSELHAKHESVKLVILGKGTEKDYLDKLTKKLGAESYIMLPGEVSMDEYTELMIDCDVVVNSCLKEGGVTNAFDCMSWGKPLICVDTGGYTRNFDSRSAHIIPRVHNRNEMIRLLYDAMLKMCDDYTRIMYSSEITKRGKEFEWSRKGEEIHNLIDSYIKIWEANK